MMRVVIVGNAETVLNNNHGEFIDSCDRIVRCNRCVVDGYESHVGSRLDIYCQPFLSHNRLLTGVKTSNYSTLNKYNECWFVEHGRAKQLDDQFIDPQKITTYIKMINGKKYDLLGRRVGIDVNMRLSIGLTAILLSMEYYPGYEIYITGFDSYRSGLYFESNDVPSSWRDEKLQLTGSRRRLRYHRNKQDNDWNKERDYINMLLDTNEIARI